MTPNTGDYVLDRNKVIGTVEDVIGVSNALQGVEAYTVTVAFPECCAGVMAIARAKFERVPLEYVARWIEAPEKFWQRI